MEYTVQWSLFAEAANPAKAKRVVARLRAVMGQSLTAFKIERYWKDRRLVKISGRTQHVAASPEAAAFEIQKVCSRLAAAWIGPGPSVYGRDNLEFEATSNPGTIVVPGVELISMDVLPLEKPDDRPNQPMLAFG